jgi:hypothetical protein
VTELPPSPAEQIAALQAAADAPGADLLTIAAQLVQLSRDLFPGPAGPPEALAAMQAAVDVLRSHPPAPGTAGVHQTRLAEDEETLGVRFSDVGEPDQALAAARQSLDSFRTAAQTPGADRSSTNIIASPWPWRRRSARTATPSMYPARSVRPRRRSRRWTTRA